VTLNVLENIRELLGASGIILK